MAPSGLWLHLTKSSGQHEREESMGPPPQPPSFELTVIPVHLAPFSHGIWVGIQCCHEFHAGIRKLHLKRNLVPATFR